MFGSRGDRSSASANGNDTTAGETNGANGIIDPSSSAAATANGIGNGSANHVGGDEDNNEESEEVSAYSLLPYFILTGRHT